MAARGLDIPEMNHVIHYHLPSKEDEFAIETDSTWRVFARGLYIAHESGEKWTTLITAWKF
jgi:hypothetical protein